MSNELIQIKEVKLVPFFTKGDSVDTILDNIAKEARSHVPDVSTTKSRGEITKNITKVTDCKTYLEAEGKTLAAEYKLIPKAIDGNRKKVKDFLTDLQSELRQPLTDWQAEKKQAKEVKEYLVKFETDLEAGYLEKENRDLKAAQEESDRKAEIERAEIKAAADAKARAEQEAAEKIAKAERDKIAAEQREMAAKQAVADAEVKATQDAIDSAAREAKARQDTIDAQERARYEAEQAEQRRILAEQQAIRDAEIAAENARLAEVQRQQDLAEQQKQAQARREDDKSHKGNINRTAMEAFIHAGLNQEQAKLAVTAIAKHLIPAVTISY